jgi:vanillate O-demethylase monooxygenase subunit
MTYLRNAWYAAAWEEDITDKPIGRTMLGQPLVFYRDSAGAPVVMSDTCPHRFAPLHLGKVEGDAIACLYHGLRFNSDGRCVHNPHGAVPGVARLAVFSSAIRHGMLWVWMGDAPADLEKLPAIPEFEVPGLVWVHGTIEVAANYQLSVDNLMDLSHVEFMHPMLSTPGSSTRVQYEARVEGSTVFSDYLLPNEPTTPLIRMLWPTAPAHVQFRTTMRWQAPSNLVLDMNVATVEGDLAEPVLRMPTLHLLTPVTATSTRYFWAAARNVATDREDVSAMLAAGSEAAFKHEDEPMIAAVQARMAMLDEAQMKPLLFKTDAGAVQARRVLSRLIAAEAAV